VIAEEQNNEEEEMQGWRQHRFSRAKIVCFTVSSRTSESGRIDTALAQPVARRRAVLLVFCAMLAAVAMAMIASPPARAAAPKALINADTVSGSPSLEETQATNLGFSVDVVSGATWTSMTQAQFAAYQVLILGDPTCSVMPPSGTGNAAVWAPVVMGTAVNTQPGNRILIGTDPVYHHFSNPGATTLIKDGIAFAGALSGRTGVYFDMSCADNGQGLATLNLLSIGAGTWTENPFPPCGGSVSKIASNPAFNDLSSADLQGWFCSDHETFPQFRDDWSPLAVATDTPSHPVCGTDPDTGNTVCGEPYVLIAGVGIIVTSPDISLTPAEATNPVDTDHTVTATVTNGGTPVAGQHVDFTVSGQNSGVTGTCVPVTCVTDSNGQVTFTYHDDNGAGDDTITASFTDSGGTKQQATAIKHWGGGPPPDPSITAHGTTFSATEGASYSGKVATFDDPDTSATASEYSATIDWGDGSPTSSGTISGSGGSFQVDGTHTYEEEGTYDVTVVITDVDNTSNTDTAHSTANVADAPLHSQCAAPATSLKAYAGPTATFTDEDPNGTSSDYTATIDWGDSSTSSGTVSPGSGSGPYTVSGTHTYSATGTYTITTTIDDAGGSQTVATCTTLVFAFAPGGGAFVIGDHNSAPASHVTFWGAQWWMRNTLTGGGGPPSFKGFAKRPTTPSCGVQWTTGPGNSNPPPAGPLPPDMGVIVTGKVRKTGAAITGNTLHIVVVKTDPGYYPNPGHAGTGTVEGQVC
jgi:hypothetical protein